MKTELFRNGKSLGVLSGSSEDEPKTYDDWDAGCGLPQPDCYTCDDEGEYYDAELDEYFPCPDCPDCQAW